jgi:uncharacterized protein (TIGR00375 family)
MEPKTLWEVGKLKGLSVIGTGDFTHPAYLKELTELLEYDEKSGLYIYKGSAGEPPYFVPTAEISLIYSTKSKTNRRVHLILIAPNFEVVEEINKYLSKLGNLLADGRPTFGVQAEALVLELMKISPEVLVIPAHAWTPWYSVFGAFSGFDTLEEAFGSATPYILAIETGLSSDPEMNWRISALDTITLVSNSDAHSPAKIGREATAFFFPLTYESILRGVREGKIAYTIEFYPEEGKYHYDGHRTCGVVLHPKETKLNSGKCPKCGAPLTIGVLHRVDDLADRDEGYIPQKKPYSVHLVPLIEILAEVYNLNASSKSIEKLYRTVIERVGTEFDILLKSPISELKEILDEGLVLALSRMREGKVFVQPGYDGVYGKVLVFPPQDAEEKTKASGQQSLFTF